MNRQSTVLGQAVSLHCITIDPAQLGGAPCIRRLRIPVSVIGERVSAGDSIESLLTDYPDLTEEDIHQAAALWRAAPHIRTGTAPDFFADRDEAECDEKNQKP